MIGCFGEAVTSEVTIDRDELEDARWFERDEVRLMLTRTHPEGLTTPPPTAIAHVLMQAFVTSPD
jgi:NAD+ diphosphatase